MIPSKPQPFWEFFDVYTLGVLSVVVGALLYSHYKKTGSLLGTISETVAASRRSSVVFSVVMTVFFPLYYAFIWFWVGPLLQLPTGFYYLLLLSAVCEMIFVWVPARPGRGQRLHQVMAGIVAASMLAMAFIILLFGQRLDMLATYVTVGFIVLSLGVGASLIFKKLREHSFVIEVVYCVGFLLSISLLAHR